MQGFDFNSQERVKVERGREDEIHRHTYYFPSGQIWLSGQAYSLDLRNPNAGSFV